MAEIGDNLGFTLVALAAVVLLITITLTLGIYNGHRASEHGKTCRAVPQVCIAQEEAK